jgi:hypothetical protein
MGEMMHLESSIDTAVTGIDSIIQYGHVVSIDKNGIVVTFGNDPSSGKIAFSCLVRPQTGDYVACLPDASGGFYVISVLERPGSRKVTMEFPSDATISSATGSINLVTGESVGIASGKGVNVITDTCTIRSRETVADLESVTARGNSIRTAFGSVQLIGRTVSTMAAQMYHKVKNYVRRSENSDNVKAAQMVRKSDGLYSLDSTHTVMISKKDTKIDGERIHMG